MKIKNKTLKHYSGKVYDLTVDNTHSYNIYGLAVHNSAAGSLIAYLTGITSVDPIQYDLLFERFHNKQKKSFPDIDCDFAEPDRIKGYIKEKYGADYVAQISNWSAMSPKVVLKDVARSLEIGGDRSAAFKLANHITSIMPDSDTIEEAMDDSQEFSKFMRQYPDVKEYACKLQNLTRQWSVHAAGVVIGDRPLYEIIPLRIEKGDTEEESVTVTQWEKTRVEEFGLVKMDVLGLNTLNVISETLGYINQKTGQNLRQEDIPLDDPKTFEMISNGENIGVFQLESSLSPLCAKIKPKDVETIAAINALGRPSCPPEQRQAYIRRRFGQETIRYTHPSLSKCLGDTYGVSLFEENMMSIAKECAGWDLNEADNLRKLTKLKGKDPELVIRTEKNFIKGCMDISGMTYEQASEIWEREISSFSGYGFNRSLIFSQEVSIIPPEGGSWQDVEIQNVKPGSTVLSRDEATGEDIHVKVLNNHYHGKLKLFKITLDNGEEVKCTINHKFRTTDGRMLPLHQILKEKLEIVTNK